MTIEVRAASLAWPDQDFELRAVGDGMEFRGYAAVFNSQSEDLGGFRETIAPGAFTRSVNAAANGSADIRMFWNHDDSRLLGSTKARTLRLSQDDRGLVAEATLPNTNDGRDMAELIRSGNVRSMSFGFTIPRKASDGGKAEDWSPDRSQRTIIQALVHEVSPVTGWPAYGATSASVRHLFAMADWDDDDSVGALVGTLTEEQRQSFFRHLNGANPAPFIDPEVAERLARLEARLAA
jgi:HK97 family phage prohead protease